MVRVAVSGGYGLQLTEFVTREHLISLEKELFDQSVFRDVEFLLQFVLTEGRKGQP